MSLVKRLIGAIGRGAKTAENIARPVEAFQRRLAQAEKLIPERRVLQAAIDAEHSPHQADRGVLRLAREHSTPEHYVLAARQMESAILHDSGIGPDDVAAMLKQTKHPPQLQSLAAYQDIRRSREAFEADPHNADLLGSLKNSIGQAVEQNEPLPYGDRIHWEDTGKAPAPFTKTEIESAHRSEIEGARDTFYNKNILASDKRLEYEKAPVEGQEQSNEIELTRTIGYSGGINPNEVTLEEKEIAEYKARKRTFVDRGMEERANDVTSSEPYFESMNTTGVRPGEAQEGGAYGLKVTQSYSVEGKNGQLATRTHEYSEEYGFYRDSRDGTEFSAYEIGQHGHLQAPPGDLDRGGEFVELDPAGAEYPAPYRIGEGARVQEAAASPPPAPPTPAAAPTSPGPAPSTPASAPVNPAPPPSPSPPSPPSPAASPLPPAPGSSDGGNKLTRGIDRILRREPLSRSDSRAIASGLASALDPLLIGAAGGAIGFAHGALTYNEEAERDPDFKNAPGIGRLNNALMEGAAGALKGVAYGAGVTGLRAIGAARIANIEGARTGAGLFGGLASGMVGGALAGGFAGSAVPGVGTAVGATLGAVTGTFGGLASTLGSASITGSFIESFADAFVGKGVGALRSGGGDFTEKAAGASDIINRSLFGRALNSSKGIQSEISTLEGRLAGDLSEDAISQMRGMGVDEEADSLTALRSSTEKLLGEKRAQAAKGLPEYLQEEVGSRPFSLAMRDLPGIAGGLAGYIGGTVAALPITGYRAWRSGIAAPYYGYEDYSDKGAGRQFVGEVFQNSAWRGTIKPMLESIAGPLTKGEAGLGMQVGGGGIGSIIGGVIGGGVAGPLGAVAGAGIGGRLGAGTLDRLGMNMASAASERPKVSPKSIAGRIKNKFLKTDEPVAPSTMADSLFNPATNLALGVGLTGAVAMTAATALPNAFMAGAEISSSGAPMGHPMNALRNRKDPIAQSRAQMEADQSNKVRMTNPGMIGLSDIEEPYHTNTSFKPTRGRHTPGKYNDTGDLVFALSALRRG